MLIRNISLVLSHYNYSHMNENPELGFTYLWQYLGLGLAEAFFLFYKNVPLITSGNKIANKLHRDMLKGTINAPINSFFDFVSSRRRHTRFSKDLGPMGVTTGFTFSWVITTVFDTITGFFIYSFLGSIWTIPFIIIYAWSSKRYKERFMKVHREVNRLCND